jgi:hypothetical protein
MNVYPLIEMVEWIEANEVRVFFSTGRVVEMKLPVRSARRARVVDGGMGLDPGNGREIGAPDLYQRPAKVLVSARVANRKKGRETRNAMKTKTKPEERKLVRRGPFPVTMTLASLRAAHRLSQSDVAKALGVNQGVVSRRERAGRHIVVSTLQDYARCLGCQCEVTFVSRLGHRFTVDFGRGRRPRR